MATIIASGGSLTAVADTAVESTAQLRYVRLRFFNTATVSRRIKVKFGAQLVEDFLLGPDEARGVGPYSATSAETIKAWQDSGTDVVYRVTGEY